MPFAEAVAGRHLRLAKEWSEWQDFSLFRLTTDFTRSFRLRGPFYVLALCTQLAYAHRQVCLVTFQ